MPRKIFIVEDDLPILEMMELMIRRLGHEPVLMPDGIEALEHIRNDPPALIVLDIMMMPINGWDFLEKLRGEYGMHDIPVIIFSAVPGVEEKIALLNDKKLGVLKKPVTFAELKSAIDPYVT